MTFVDFTPASTEQHKIYDWQQWPQAEDASLRSKNPVPGEIPFITIELQSFAYFTVRTGIVNFNDAILRIAYSVGF